MAEYVRQSGAGFEHFLRVFYETPGAVFKALPSNHFILLYFIWRQTHGKERKDQNPS
jgi:hypothetical protein